MKRLERSVDNDKINACIKAGEINHILIGLRRLVRDPNLLRTKVL